MAIAILGAFLLGLAWIGVIALGALLGWRGLRGHMIDQEPRCRRCGYSARGLPLREAACPECGARFGTGAIAFGRRRPRVGLVVAGSGIILSALVPLLVYVMMSSSPFGAAPAAAGAAGPAAQAVSRGVSRPGPAQRPGAAAPSVAASSATALEEQGERGSTGGLDDRADLVRDDRSRAGGSEPSGAASRAAALASEPASAPEAAAAVPDALAQEAEAPSLVTVDRGEKRVVDLLDASGLISLGWQPVELDLRADDISMMTPERLAGAMGESDLRGLIGQPMRLRWSALPSSGSLLTPFEPVASERRLRFGGAAGPPEAGAWRRPASSPGAAGARSIGTRVPSTRVTGTRAGQ